MRLLSVLLCNKMLVAVFSFCLISSVTFSQKTWDGGAGTNNWNDGTNWNPNGVPASTDAVTIGNTYTVTLNTSTTIASLTIGGGSSGSLTIGNNNNDRTLTVTGNVSVASGATFNSAGNGGNVLNIGGSLQNNGTFDMNNGSADCDVTFNGSANQTLSGTGGTTDFNLITVNNSGAANNNIVEVMPSNFTAVAGFLTLTRGILKMSGTYNFTNTFFSSTSPTINSDEGFWLNNPNVTVTGQNGDTQLSGLLRITQGTYNIGASADYWFLYNTGAIVTIEGGAFNLASAFAGNNPTSSTITYTQTGGVVTVNTLGNTGSFGTIPSFGIETAGSVFTMSGGSIVLQRLNDAYTDFYNVASTNTVTGGTIQVGNSSSPVPSFSYWIYSTVPLYDLVINNTNGPTGEIRANTTVLHDVTISTGGTLDVSTSSFGLSVGHDFINNGTFTQQSGTVTFDGSGLQAISGTTTTTFYGLTANNTAGNTTTGITLNRPATVSNTLTLTSGHITTTSNLLTMSAGSSVSGADFATRVSGGSDNSFVNGPMVKTGNTDFLFPVGKLNAGQRYCGISGISAADSYQAEFMRASASALGSITASGLSHVSNCEYWNISRSGSTTANITLSWTGSSNCNMAAYVNDLPSLMVAHFGTSWDSYANNATTGNVSAGSVTRNAVAVFSPFALGSTSGGTNPLPVTLVNVKAYKSGAGNKIEWTNLTEAGVALYEVQRSTDGAHFSSMATLPARSNNNDKEAYDAYDNQAVPVTYYRVKALGIDGKAVMSAVLKVADNSALQDFVVYPNPVSGSQATIRLSGASAIYTLSLFGANGQLIKRETISHTGGTASRTIQLPAAMAAGIYHLQLANGEKIQATTLIKN